MTLIQVYCTFCDKPKDKITPIKYKIGDFIKAASLCDICMQNETSIEDPSDKLLITHIGNPLYEETKP